MKRISYTLSNGKLDSDKNIAILSNMFLSQHTSSKKMRDTVKTLELISPTHIVIPGNLYVPSHTILTGTIVPDFIQSLSNIADVFYVRGYSEQQTSIIPMYLLNNSNPHLHLFRRKHNIIFDGINIVALNIPYEYYSMSKSAIADFLYYQIQYLIKHARATKGAFFNVLLCPDPNVLDILPLSREENGFYPRFNLVISPSLHGCPWPKWCFPLFQMTGMTLDNFSQPLGYGLTYNGEKEENIIISEGITKFGPEFKQLEFLEMFHEGTIENILVRTPKRK